MLIPWVNHSAPSGPAAMPLGPLIDRVLRDSSVSRNAPDFIGALIPQTTLYSSGPAARDADLDRLPAGVGTEYSVNVPAVVMRPTLLVQSSVNHSAPSGPVATEAGPAPDVGIEYSVICALLPGTAFVGIRAMLLFPASENHSAPSGPLVIGLPSPFPKPPGVGNSVNAPEVVTRPILLAHISVNHSAPSDPTVIPAGPLAPVGGAKFWITALPLNFAEPLG